MKRIILLYIIFSVSNDSKVLSQEGWYISPGVQIGIDSKGDLHRAVQITLGILIEEHPFTTGLTYGYKWYRKLDKSGEKSWKRYNYYDLQFQALESIILPGIGIGLIQGDNILLKRRFKLWSGWFLLPSYEFSNMKNEDSKHYFGLFGVLPLPIGVSGI
ncbi:hypothetical protein OA955_02510 [Candidatus Marinimicrobia bacterium]|nr:hypothetical protein [Candidatus Neomarinimicrobiota bacterium]